jgi:hypothetical protein
MLNSAVTPFLYAAEFRRCLEDLDIVAARQLWSHMLAHLPQPNSDDDVLATLHYARTQTQSIVQRKRFYSHRWLLDHELPSGLPDHLRSKAERMYPVTVESVGIAVKAVGGDVARALAVRGAMERAVLECLADGEKNNNVVRTRMMEARRNMLR